MGWKCLIVVIFQQVSEGAQKLMLMFILHLDDHVCCTHTYISSLAQQPWEEASLLSGGRPCLQSPFTVNATLLNM